MVVNNLPSLTYRLYKDTLLKIGFIKAKEVDYMDETISYLLDPRKMLKPDFQHKQPKSLSIQIPIFMLLFGPIAFLFLLFKNIIVYIEGDEVDMLVNNGSYTLLIYAIFGAPVVEELIHRAPLRLNYFNIFLALSGSLLFIPFALFISPLKFNGYRFLIVFTIQLLFFLFMLVLKKQKSDTFSKHYYIYFYIMAFYFAYLHINNFEVTTKLTWVMGSIAIFIEIFLGALMLSFIRLKYGLKYAIFTHMGMNAIFSIPSIVKLLGS